MNQSADEAAVVLSGGGAYGAFSVGIMKVLFAGRSPVTGYKPLDAGIFSGTSVGAFNAASIVGGGHLSALQAALRLEEIWVERIAGRAGGCGNGVFRFRGNPADYFNPACYAAPGKLVSHFAGDSLAVGRYLFGRTANLLASSGALLDRATSAVNLSSLIDPTRFYEMVRETMHLGDRLGRDVFMYSITVDPLHDTPQALAEFADRHGAQPGWLFLTGTPTNLAILRGRFFAHGPGHSHEGRDAGDCSMRMLRYGNEAVGLWGSVPSTIAPEAIALRISWVESRPQPTGPSIRKGPMPLDSASLMMREGQ